MNNKAFRIMFVLLFLFMIVQVNAEGRGKKSTRTIYKPNGSPSWVHFNINNISTWFADNGDSDINPQTGNAGFVFPKGSNKTAVFESGLVYAGKIKGQIRVDGSTYGSGMVPGAIINGVPQDPHAASVHIYRVRPDWKTGDISSEINDGEGTAAEIRKQYENDWNTWPAKLGAPYKDVNHDGKYEPSVDIPGFPGASQTLWYVANDFDTTQAQALYGSKGLGIEMQVTIWGYKSTSALGDMLFRKYTLINKGQDSIKDMYVSMWSDVDDGDAGDDYNGCSIPLSLYFTYNGKAIDAVYGNTPPAIGFDFFQGPIIKGKPTDKAIFNNKVRMGYKNLPMTAFYYFINGDPILTDPTLGDYSTGALEFYNLMQGLISTTGAPFIDPLTGEATKFPLSGDPITGKGWVDGMLNPPGDRRGGMVSGPFTMAVGDTQEVVVSEMAAGDFDHVGRIGALSLLEYYDQQAQTAYDNFFNVPKSPPQPKVTVKGLNDEILLRWDEDPTSVNKIESYDDLGYKFQGYVVYQMPSANATFQEAKIVATYDIKDGIGKVIGPAFSNASGMVLPQVLKFGSDSGIKHDISIKNDLFNSGAPLRNGTKYYFVVTSYAVNVNPSVVPIVLESSPITYTAIPHTPNPGDKYDGKTGEVLKVDTVGTHIGTGSLSAVVIDPTKTTGQTYTVFFHKDTDSTSATYNRVLWGIKNGKGTVVLDNDTMFSSPKGLAVPPVVDGIQVTVTGPEKSGLAGWNYAGPRWVSGVNWGGAQFFGGMDLGMNFFGSTITDNWPAVQLLWAGDTLANITDHSAAALAAASQKQFPDRWSKGAEYRRDQSYAFGGIGEIPFAAYDVSVPNKPRRLNICFVEDANNGSANLLWDMGWDGTQFAGLGGREYLFIMNSNYDKGAEYNNTNWGPVADVLYAIWPSARGSHPYLQAPFTFNIIANVPFNSKDSYTYKAPLAVKNNKALAEKAVEKINVFPNPYYGTQTNEINKYQRFVTFSHLPQKATIRVFNLAGQIVKTIRKNSTSQFAKWDLKNEQELPVASGIYIVYIDMPALGKSKILKVAIIQETQILDRF